VEGETGLRVDGARLEEIVTALQLLLGPAGENMGTAGCKRAHSEFSWEHVAARTQNLI
jgi:hypothetical protein